MKKFLSVFWAVLICLSFTACNYNKDAQKDPGTSEKEMYDTISSLVSDNANCVLNIFDVKTLSYSGEPVYGNVYKTDDAAFENYSAFEDYIRNIYCKQEADRLLYNFPDEGKSLYLNVDGELCIDLDNVLSRGYFRDLNNFSLTIDEFSNIDCSFTVKTTETEPGDPQDDLTTEYTVSASAVLENGKWKLEKMFR